ncbi:flagellar assembly protein FliH [uncultured Campylobacter sp.]|uniref:flagellar assembly protein FliH n=1 Tax=uncultured Campylobacter sp. TaxID=218934 RepID=UPI00261E4FB3|nr:flagellar assembly protein FliH [uncultured Campylobacter sp.]
MIKNTNVISQNNSNSHIIDSYHFKVMSEFSNEQEQQTSKEDDDKTKQEKEPEKTENTQTQDDETPKEHISSFQSDFVEDLLKKTDEMSSNIIKLQMQIESQESEFNNRLNTELENAKKTAEKQGYEKAKSEFEKELSEMGEKCLKSVAKLDEACEKLDNFIEKNEKELANTAIEIAKDVISKELEENSSKIALNLAKELMEELKGASSIELKVSPVDYDFIKSQLNNIKNLKISLDDAISKGSVIVLSDVANIESNLNARLDKIKKMVAQ